jgi:hypothetical protein
MHTEIDKHFNALQKSVDTKSNKQRQNVKKNFENLLNALAAPMHSRAERLTREAFEKERDKTINAFNTASDNLARFHATWVPPKVTEFEPSNMAFLSKYIGDVDRLRNDIDRQLDTFDPLKSQREIGDEKTIGKFQEHAKNAVRATVDHYAESFANRADGKAMRFNEYCSTAGPAKQPSGNEEKAEN